MEKYNNVIKKVNKILLIFIILIALMVGFSTKTHADSGYDTSYSGGSSSYSGEYSSHSSSSRNSSSTSSSVVSNTENNSLISNQTTTSKEIKDSSKEDIKNIESKISDLSEKIDNNSKTNLYLIIAIAVIGTISIITFIMTIIVLIKRKNK